MLLLLSGKKDSWRLDGQHEFKVIFVFKIIFVVLIRQRF